MGAGDKVGLAHKEGALPEAEHVFRIDCVPTPFPIPQTSDY